MTRARRLRGTVAVLAILAAAALATTAQNDAHAAAGPHVWTSKAQRIGSDHRAVSRVRTARTKGLSFALRAPWQGDTGAVPNIVTRYAGHAVDSHLTRKAARHAHRAEGCWAGTTVADVRLHFHVGRVASKT
jgi:hypothetical protein